jgi:hydroxyacylglutathione hydrolase
MAASGINIIPLKAFNDNYIWLWIDPITTKAWVVDPGDAQPVLDYLQQNAHQLGGILITHHHRDHSGGVAALLAQFSECEVYGFNRDLVTAITHLVKNDDEIDCGGLTFCIFEIPGHTLDHIAYYADGILFCGDTLFSAGCGRLFEGTAAQLFAALTKLAALPPKTQVYCGHEYTLANLYFAREVEPNNLAINEKIAQIKNMPTDEHLTLPSTLAFENVINPFLRCTKSDVVAAVTAYANKPLTTALAVFTYLRQWKDSFKVNAR